MKIKMNGRLVAGAALLAAAASASVASGQTELKPNVPSPGSSGGLYSASYAPKQNAWLCFGACSAASFGGVQLCCQVSPN